MTDDSSVQRIYKLSKSLANQIAAGEVIERPASVVKELIENSLDASATEILIEVKQGGSHLIRVKDNGQGIYPDDLILAIERHSTSKLRCQADLERIVNLGFRGEALSSIAAVSRCVLSSRQNDNEYGFSIMVNPNSDSPSLKPVSHALGTTVEVRDLFFNTPGRRKFLRSERTEFLHIRELVKRIALSRFNTSIYLQNNGRSVFNFKSSSKYPEDRVLSVCGESFLNNSLVLDHSNADSRIWGWLGTAQTARSHTDQQYFYLNGRIIKDRRINHTIRMAYQDLLYPGRYPVFILYLEIDAALADVNVHPTKHEVRFREARNVHDFIYSSLIRTLNESISSYHVTANSDVIQNSKLADHVNDERPTYKRSITDINKERSVVEGYKILSQIQGRFMIVKNKDDLILVHIPNARELIARTRIMEALEKGSISSRPLLVPLTMNKKEINSEKNLIEAKILARLGIVIEQIAPETVIIREVPVLMAYADVVSLVKELTELINSVDNPDNSIDHLINIMVKHANDSTGLSISSAEMYSIMNHLQRLKNKFIESDFCNVWRKIDIKELENMFSKNL